MTYKKRSRACLALILAALLLLTGCAGAQAADIKETSAPVAETAAPAAETAVPTPQPAAETAVPTPQPTAEAQPAAEGETAAADSRYSNHVTVGTVDEFLAAIAPNTQILLEPGVYDLSTAADYGRELYTGYYTWEDAYDGYQLVIHDVMNLAILGGSRADATLAAVPRYANVLTFRSCLNPLVMTLTAGHTQEPGYCAGGVLEFDDCQAPCVLDCGLYGCGTMGVYGVNCRNLTVRDTEIYECSVGAVWATACFDVRIENCIVRDCGVKDPESSAYVLFMPDSCTGFALVNTEVVRNKTSVLLESHYSREVCLLGCGIEDNMINNYAFSFSGKPALVEDCSFSGNRINSYYDSDNYTGYAVNRQGEELISFDLNRMTRKEAVYDGPADIEPESVSGSLAPDGSTTEYHVKTVDEFLAAIGPDATIYIDVEQLDLSAAERYGGYGSEYYFWDSAYDGPCLVISGVSNLHIVGQGKDKTELVAVPRYADVLRFVNCENISVEALTAGHTKTGECAGDVLAFSNVSDLTVRDCGLYGCGCYGIRGENCYNMLVENTEIYSCSFGAFYMYQCINVSMSGMDIHNMPSPETATLYDCDNFSFEGKLLGGGNHKL